jgi:Leucine-rich repeat (LRR) protein
MPDDPSAFHLNLWKKRLGRVPAWVWERTDLETLVLADNELSEVSSRIGRLKKLRMLDLGHNRLTQVPDALADLDGLTDFLYLHDNQLTSLPSSLARLTTLRYINVSENAFETWPESISWMAGLIEIRASDNRLTSLPESIASLKELRHIDLRGNALTHLPPAIVALPRLEKLDLRWTNLQWTNSQSRDMPPPAWLATLEARGCVVYR